MEKVALSKVCIKCGNPATKTCSICKVARYCSVECQKSDWKTHKVICSKPGEPKAKTQEQNTIVFTQEEEDCLGTKGLNDLRTMMQQQKMGQKEKEAFMKNIVVGDLAPYHEEYKAQYPNANLHFDFLKDSFLTCKFSPSTTQALYKSNFDEASLVERWGPALLLEDQRQKVLEFSKSQPGEIFKDGFIAPYGVSVLGDGETNVRDNYQCVKNVQTLKQDLVQGKTYVGLGFVDNSYLLFAQLENKSETTDPVKYYGIDMIPISVARSLVIYEMLKNGSTINSIFELWYLSCIGQETANELKKAIESILDSKVENLQREVVDLLKYWQDNTISVQDSQTAWFKTSSKAYLYPLANMISKDSRLKFARYELAGVFGRDEDYAQGNPTFFALPPSMSSHIHIGDNLFYTVATEHFFIDQKFQQAEESKTQESSNGNDFVAHIIGIYKNNLMILQERIRKGLIECHYQMMNISLHEEDKETIEFIKNLKPFKIDWGNIPEYMSNKDFIKMAKLCSSPDTAHTAHFINWVQKVKGTHIYDYPKGKQQVYNHHVVEKEKAWTMMFQNKEVFPGFRPDIIDAPQNKFHKASAMNYADRYMNYYFGEECEDKVNFALIGAADQDQEIYNIFTRAQVIFHVSFSFDIEKQQIINEEKEEEKQLSCEVDKQETAKVLTQQIAENLTKLNDGLKGILANSKTTDKCQLLAVSKTKPLADLIAAYDAGQRHFGENYVEEFVEKANTLKDSHKDIDFHFIGHIQGNKVKKLVQCLNLNMIETVDTEKLAKTLQKECSKIEARKELPPIDVLVQVLIDDSEASKHGQTPENAIKLAKLIREECPMLRFRGIMSMGAVGNEQEFKGVLELRNQMLTEFTDLNADEFMVSMGTSQDYEAAILVGGATQVRLGTTIFGARDYSKK